MMWYACVTSQWQCPILWCKVLVLLIHCSNNAETCSLTSWVQANDYRRIGMEGWDANVAIPPVETNPQKDRKLFPDM